MHAKEKGSGMQFGYFDDEKHEYVIMRPDTRRSWSNYLGSTDCGAMIANNACGYSFFPSAVQGHFIGWRPNNIPMDQPGWYFYISAPNSGEFWSASWRPVGKPPGDEEYSSVVIERRFRGKSFRMEIVNPDGIERGTHEMTINGRQVAGNLIPPNIMADVNIVHVVMGK